MSLVALHQAGRLKHVISTNTDGLHRRSGLPGVGLSELHGNGNKARCDQCFRWCFIDQRVRVAGNACHNHETGQHCTYPRCRGMLHDTIINFGEYLHEEVQQPANTQGSTADLLLVLGSSLRVITCDALESIQEQRGALVIVNLQKTPYDRACKLRIFSDCDTVMQMLMEKLDMPIPPWVLKRYATVQCVGQRVTFLGTDETRAMPYTFAKKVVARAIDGTLLGKGGPAAKASFAPISFELAAPMPAGIGYVLEVTFMGHNQEPSCRIPMVAGVDRNVQLAFNVDGDKQWVVTDIA